MNCKQGELAVIVSGIHKQLIGRFVTCVSICHELDHTGFVHWNTEPALFIPGFRLPIGVGDITLRPIRPGDITDSEVRDLYAPSDEHMTATEVLAHQHKPVHAGYPAP